MIAFTFLAFVSIIIGLVFFSLGIFVLRRTNSLNSQHYKTAYGKISEIVSQEAQTSYTKKKPVYHYPVLEFDFNGTSHLIKSNMGISIRKLSEKKDGKKFATGDEIKIRVYNEDAQTAIIDSQSLINQTNSAGSVLLLIGISLIIIGLVLLVQF